MNKTDIDWCDMTWNPVTGCLHGCKYCFAANYARRFGGWTDDEGSTHHTSYLTNESGLHVLDEPLHVMRGVKLGSYPKAPFPFGFEPTLYRYRLEEPAHVRKPQKIFTVDCGDLFGSWVPDEWITAVFDACAAASKHRYIFLTKAAMGYYRLNNPGIKEAAAAIMPISVFGISATNEQRARKALEDLGDVPKTAAALLCLEPMHSRIVLPRHELSRIDWVIVGAETGNRRGKVVPKREWVAEIIDQCRKAETPVFLKGNLAAVWGEELIQEYPSVLQGVGK